MQMTIFHPINSNQYKIMISSNSFNLLVHRTCETTSKKGLLETRRCLASPFCHRLHVTRPLLLHFSKLPCLICSNNNNDDTMSEDDVNNDLVHDFLAMSNTKMMIMIKWNKLLKGCRWCPWLNYRSIYWNKDVRGDDEPISDDTEVQT